MFEKGSALNLPLFKEDISPAWLTGVLRSSGLAKEEEVLEVRCRTIGAGLGFVGEVLELQLVLDCPTERIPVSMVLKLPSAGDNHRVGQVTGAYEREIRFYKELGQALTVRIPALYYGEMETETDPEKSLAVVRFLNRLPMWMLWPAFRLAGRLGGRRRGYALLMEDLGYLRRVDQVAGCTARDARTALESMAALHARFWGGIGLEDFRWVVPLELMTRLTQAMFLKAVPEFVRDNREWLSNRDRVVLEALKTAGIPLMQSLVGGSRSLLHGDFRLDNLLFDDERNEVVILDWQTLIQGPVGLELAYFLSASMNQDTSEEELHGLLKSYHDRLCQHGIDLSFDDLVDEYERGLLVVLLRIIPAEYQDMLELGDERGRDITITWIERVLDKLRRIDTDRLFSTVSLHG